MSSGAVAGLNTGAGVHAVSTRHNAPEQRRLIEGLNGMSDCELADGELLFSTNRARLDIGVIHRFISEQSYWTPGIARELVERAIANSLCFGAYANHAQIGFARVVSDFVGFAYLADVFVLPEWRGRRVGKRLMRFVIDHPQLQNLRRFMLATRDAHALYTAFGFEPLSNPQRFMERFDADALSRPRTGFESHPRT
jgi:GNAT superfamily N-acetyltransferase